MKKQVPIISDINIGGNINRHLTCIILNKQVLNSLYVAYCLERDVGKEQFQSTNQGDVKAGLNFNAINTLRSMVPTWLFKKLLSPSSPKSTNQNLTRCYFLRFFLKWTQLHTLTAEFSTVQRLQKPSPLSAAFFTKAFAAQTP